MQDYTDTNENSRKGTDRYLSAEYHSRYPKNGFSQALLVNFVSCTSFYGIGIFNSPRAYFTLMYLCFTRPVC